MRLLPTGRWQYGRRSAAARTYSTNLFFIAICQFRRVDHDIGKQAAEAIMDLLCDVGFSRCSIKIEDAGLAPPLHDRKAIEQDDLSLQCKDMHRICVSTH